MDVQADYLCLGPLGHEAAFQEVDLLATPACVTPALALTDETITVKNFGTNLVNLMKLLTPEKDGTLVRAKFAIRPMDDGWFAVLLTPLPDAPAAPSVVYTVGDVLAEWRAAERRLEALPDGAPERHAILEDIAEFRERYQLLFQRGLGNLG